MSIVKFKKIWTVVKDEFKGTSERDKVTIERIKDDLEKLDIELSEIRADSSKKGSKKWEVLKQKDFLVYIKGYCNRIGDEEENSKFIPFICGITKTGKGDPKSKRLDLDFSDMPEPQDLEKEEFTKSYGRHFLNQESGTHVSEVIWVAKCEDKPTALMLEDYIQKKYFLFRS